MATETHIAGLQMDVRGQYLLQRCAWCGAVLLHYDRTRIAVTGDEYRDPGMFEVGRLVQCGYDGEVARFGEVGLSRTMMVVLDETDTLPDDACALNLPFEFVAAEPT